MFEAAPAPGRKKWYSNVPYPYMSAYVHVGFALSFLRAEFQSRFRRMTGYNVLHPQAFHCTGLPILGAARRVAEKEPRQIEILRKMGIPDRDIPKFADPMHWIEVFPQATIADLKALGAAIDWRRSFITTYLNPPYDAFVRWQFRRLREGGYLKKDRHPVIWCPKDAAPIGDHDRLEGEGETPVEYTLLKFPLADGRILVAATIRPETVFGQTNLWVDPEVEYVVAEVAGERWVLNETAVRKLAEQGKSASLTRRVRGADLVGREAVAPAINRAVPILPSSFIDQGRGTGIVTSVPSDAPDDYVALRDLQRDDALLARFRLDPERIRAIVPVPIIRTPGWGPLPGVEIVERMGIRNQGDREKLEAAKAEVYRTGFYQGVLNENCGPYAGVRVEVAKEEIRRQLEASRQADLMYEPSGEVVCRCTTPAIVKLVEDQWFLAYGDPVWKAKAHEALAGMTLHPDGVRKQFDYIIDWLRDWPAAHHRGLGTKLPWDEGWVIESLSDSTVYMAYYTIAHALQGGSLRSSVPWAGKLDDAFFDYVFREEGDPAALAGRLGLPRGTLEDLRREFLYWYPFDLRNTGKDLVQNHMTFCLFNHVALFPPEQWPRGFGVNGYVQMAGRKMSKSRGNVWYLRDALREWGADVVRLTVANAGDGQDDPNFDMEFAASARARLADWYAFATRRQATRTDRRVIDAWFLSTLARAVGAARASMESMLYKNALRQGYFDLQAAWSWYVRRSGGRPHGDVLARFIDVQTRLLAPFTPHLCEEIWSRLGREGFASSAPYPEAEAGEVDPAAEAAESLLQATLADVREILKVTGLKPKRLVLYTAPAWKVRLRSDALALAAAGPVAMHVLMDRSLADPVLKDRAKDVAAYAKRLVEELRHARPADLARQPDAAREHDRFREDAPFLRSELGVRVDVYRADDPDRWDPARKADHAIPGRPAIYVE
ncbi:MAG: leucine--tRNA ligase [Euryarchaeota archaeon RBG_19FT_COMBO_69_17]|nr:MAG: leucine--tRNA ligase [Euryarchaeota archaeon RBG_19FT_COMBO_69_17]